MKALVIAEKSQLKQRIDKYVKDFGFKDELTCIALHGHICGIKEPNKIKPEWEKWKMEFLPMIPEQFEYEVREGDVELFNRIRNEMMSGKYDYVINFTDPEREGQHIFYSVYNLIGCNLPVKRLWLKDPTDEGLKKALNSMKDDLNDSEMVNLTKSAFLRAYADWLVGMNATRAISIKNNFVVRSGRVVSAVLNILVNRELAIRNFVSSTSYDCLASFGPKNFEGIYYNPESEENGAFRTLDEYNEFINNLPNNGKITNIEQKNVKDYAPQLYSTAALQIDANTIFGYTLTETAEVLQYFWDNQIFTYPRTDCYYITKEMASLLKKNMSPIYSIPELSKYLDKITDRDIEKLMNNKKYVDDSKVSAHTAIILTGAKVDYDSLNIKQKNIFYLVARQMIGIFMDPIIMKKTKVVTNVGKHQFITTGSTVIDAGYGALFGKKLENNELPNLKEGEAVNICGLESIERITTAPKRFTDSTLIKAMINAGRYIDDKDLRDVLNNKGNGEDEAGIGTPATREGIVAKLTTEYKNKNGTYQFVERKGKSLAATDVAIRVIESLDGSTIISPVLTAQWEQKLIQIERGKFSDKQFMSELIKYVEDEISFLKTTKQQPGISSGNGSSVKTISDFNCPFCHSNVLESEKGYFCENIKAEANPCPFVLSKQICGAKINHEVLRELIAFIPTKPLKMKNPKTKKSFEASLLLNKETKKVEFSFSNEKRSGEDIMDCPKCKGKVVKVEGKYGPYYTCSNKCLMVSEKINGHNLTKSEIKKLLKGENIGPFDLLKKDGVGKFTASLSLKEDGKINYIFSNTK